MTNIKLYNIANMKISLTVLMFGFVSMFHSNSTKAQGDGNTHPNQQNWLKEDPTKKYTTTGFEMLRIGDGKLAEHWDIASK
jgi:predicted SnoaL-like aldol condensation-catalyzing enzyme